MPVPPLAALQALDYGLLGAAGVLLVVAARALFSGQGRAQMGGSFALAASGLAAVGLGRHLDSFTIADGVRLGVGVLLLLPALRMIFKPAAGSAVGAAVSVVLASLIAGPVVQRHLEEGAAGDMQRETRAKQGLVEIREKLTRMNVTRDRLAAEFLQQKAAVEKLGAIDADRIANDAEARTALELYAKLKDGIAQLDQGIATLEQQRAEIKEAQSNAAEVPMTEAERMLKEMEEAIAGADSDSALEAFTKQKDLADLYAEDFGGGE